MAKEEMGLLGEVWKRLSPAREELGIKEMAVKGSTVTLLFRRRAPLKERLRAVARKLRMGARCLRKKEREVTIAFCELKVRFGDGSEAMFNIKIEGKEMEIRWGGLE